MTGTPGADTRATQDIRVGGVWADPRLVAYLVAGFGALVTGMTVGRFEIAALGAPFLALAMHGLLRGEPGSIGARVSLDTTGVIEGDVVAGTIILDWDGVAEVDVMLAGGHGVTAVEPSPVTAWALPAGHGPVTLAFRLRTHAWGVHDVGALWVRARRPGAMLYREHKFAPPPPLRVLPAPARLDRLLPPAEPRAVAGSHSSRFRGHGTDFAELRPYRPGDRLRDVSWATTARLGEPWVTVHHSERTGTVLLLLDAVFSRSPRGTEALTRAARAAWAVASAHLNAQDRVGLLALGRTTAWISPRSGRRARWLLLEELLAVGSAAEDPHLRPRVSRRPQVPADALIIGVTSLQSRDYVRALLHYRRIGHPAAALVIDTSDIPAGGDGIVDATARRLWLAQREGTRQELERAGVATALVGAGQGVGPAVSALRRRLVAMKAARAVAR
ncbi:MAG TPA: DUF58 domain-containing protein [Longimicrobiales bacterium]|nr:DUF58 domain-containing protein [Longimicrobiales bacterium]